MIKRINFLRKPATIGSLIRLHLIECMAFILFKFLGGNLIALFISAVAFLIVFGVLDVVLQTVDDVEEDF